MNRPLGSLNWRTQAKLGDLQPFEGIRSENLTLDIDVIHKVKQVSLHVSSCREKLSS